MLKNIKLAYLRYLMSLSLLSACLMPLYAIGGEFMGMLKKELAYPFSGFSGQLLFNGEPAANAKITRVYELESKKELQKDEVVADQQGRFSFDAITVQYRTPVLGAFEFLSHQDVIVEYKGEEYQIWGGGKFNKDEYAEFGGKPNNFRCELTEDIRRVEIEKGVYGTNCHWDID
ncbi:MAG: DUF6795 domain-containing protein [Cellvibrionaceae bacterium]